MNFASIPVPKGLSLVYVQTSQWHGKRSLKAEYLHIPEVDSKLANLGNVNMVDPESLKEFRNLNNQSLAVLNKFGIKFGDAYAVPDLKLKETLQQLEYIKTRWYEIKDKILNTYHDNIEKWAEEAEKIQQGFGEVVLQKAFSTSYIDKQIQFNIKSASDMVDGLERTLLEEISERFDDKINQLLERKRQRGELKISRKDFIILKEVRSKLLVNLMVSNKAEPIVNYIETFLDSIPDDKNLVSDSASDRYIEVINTLSKPQMIMSLKNSQSVVDSSANEIDDAEIYAVGNDDSSSINEVDTTDSYDEFLESNDTSFTESSMSGDQEIIDNIEIDISDF